MFKTQNLAFFPYSTFLWSAQSSQQTAITTLRITNIGFYNRDGVRLLRSTNWIFKFSSLSYYSLKVQVTVNKKQYFLWSANWVPDITVISLYIK
jgi:hypothetical protein